MAISHAQLKAFHAVAMHGGFSRAAERLHLTQPAVSDQVRKMEEYFGVLLFYRNKRTVRLSELGEQLLGITQKLFALENEAEELLDSYRTLNSGKLVLAVDSTAHVLPYIARFNQNYPGIALSLLTGNTEKSLRRLFEYQADIAVVAGSYENDPRLVAIALSDDPIVAFVARSHPLAGRKRLSLADLSALPMVLREQGSVTRQIIEEEMQRAGLEIRQAIEAEGREAANEIVAAGIGVGVVSTTEFGNDSRVKAIPISDCRKHMRESLVCLAEQAQRKIIRAFTDPVAALHLPGQAD